MMLTNFYPRFYSQPSIFSWFVIWIKKNWSFLSIPHHVSVAFLTLKQSYREVIILNYLNPVENYWEDTNNAMASTSILTICRI